MLVNHIAEEIGRLVNVLVVNLESNLRCDAKAQTRSLVRNKNGKIGTHRGQKRPSHAKLDGCLGLEHLWKEEGGLSMLCERK